jgi:hypothetical protein
LDLKIFISSKAFYYPTFFHKQLELTRFVLAFDLTNVLKTCGGEVDTTSGKPIVLYNALELGFFLIFRGLDNSNKIKETPRCPQWLRRSKAM